MKLLLVRHGEISSNVKKVYAGRSAELLTERGIMQVNEAAQKVQACEVHSLYSSPIERAKQSAGIIGRVICKDFIIDDAFREIEMGPWEGLTEKYVAHKFPDDWKIWNTRPAELNLPGRETLESLLKRSLKGVRNIYERESDKTVVVVSHVAVIRVLLMWDAKQSLNFYKTIEVPNASVFELTIDDIPKLHAITGKESE